MHILDDGSLKLNKMTLKRDNSGNQTDNETVDVFFNDEVSQTVASTEVITIPKGSLLEVEKSREFVHSLEIQDSANVEGKIGADLSIIKAEIYSTLGKKIGRAIKEKEFISHKLTLDGNAASKYQIIWLGKWRKGTVTLGEKSFSFRIKEWEELEVKAIN